jgi:hypothetical protein
MCINIRVIHYSCQVLMKLACSRQIFEKYSDIKFHENPSSGSRDVPRGQADTHKYIHTDRQTNMTKPIVPFRNCAKAHKSATKLFF